MSRSVVVTGGSGGIGRSIVARLLRDGDRVEVLDSDTGALEALRAEHGGAVGVHAVDVADADAVRNALAGAGKRGLDVLVNAAAIIRRVDVLQMSVQEWRAVLDVNVTGAFIATQAAAPLMAAGGAVVNIASINGERHNPALVAYGTSKAALLAMTKGFAVALAPRAIRVNALVGGHVLTDFSRARLEQPEVHDKVVRSIPLGRLGTPDDFAGAVSFLAGPETSWVTGAALAVDGGWLAADSTSIPVP